MAWSTPKTDWTTDDVINTTDLNRIEGNIFLLGDGTSQSIAAAANLDITTTTNCFYLTGGPGNINYILKTGRQAGSLIFLTFESSTIVLKNNAGTPGSGYAKILSGGDFNVPGAEQSVGLFYDGIVWRILYRFN